MTIPEQVRPAYQRWEDFLYEQVDFWLKTSDKHTKEHCARVLLYQIFKDADALDRFRLGPGGFDPKYLRTGEAKELVKYARSVWEECRPKEQTT